MRSIVALALLLLVSAARGQQTADPRVTRVAAPRDAVAHMANDMLSVPMADQPFVKYIWAPNPSPLHTAAIVYTLNAVCSHSADLYYPAVLHNGALIRFDMRALAPRPDDFNNLRDNWEDLTAFEPYFHTNRLVTKDIQVIYKLVLTEPYKGEDGKVYSSRWVEDPTADPTDKNVKVKNTTQEVLASEFSIHSGLPNALLVHSLNKSQIPIVRSDWFMLKAWTTLDNGFYYRFTGIEKRDGKLISLNDWLKLAGTSDSDFKRWKADQLPADERAAIFRSFITEKPRAVVAFNGKETRPSLGSPVVLITEDIQRGNFDPKAHPLRTLINPKFDGHEAIKRRRNGTLEFIVADKNGKVLPSVPEGIAVDRTIPGAGPVSLEPGMSCLACHGGQEGYLPVQNDVAGLLAANQQVYDDENSTDDALETLEVLNGKYKGNFKDILTTLRRDTGHTCNLITHGQSFANVAGEIVTARDRYLYESITPRIACRDLGFAVKSDIDGQLLLPALLPPIAANRFGIHMEDPLIAALRGYNIEKWRPRIRREEWEQIYADAALRALTEENRRTKGAKK